MGNKKHKDPQSWLEYGISEGWVRGFCATHDIYENSDELERYENDGEACIPVYRIVGLDGNTHQNLGRGQLPAPDKDTSGQRETPYPQTKKH